MSESTGRVLIVDDEADICELLVEELADRGYECQSATSVDSAVSQAKIFVPHVIVSDVRMPMKSGVELLRIIGSNDTPTPVILISGYTDASLQEIYELGAAALLSKPLDFDQLATQIEQLIQIGTLSFGSRSSNRAPTAFQIKIRYTDSRGQLRTISSAKVLNISRSGIYVEIPSLPTPEIGSTIAFEFHDPVTNHGSVRGNGICRWFHSGSTSKSDSRTDFKSLSAPGFGLEFQSISGDCFEALMKYASMVGSFWSPQALSSKSR